MNYRSAGRRCAVNFNDLKLPIEASEALKILTRQGYHKINITNKVMVELARDCVSHSKYRRGASIKEAPEFLDCSLLTKWVYKCRGIWIPRHSIAQKDFCKIEVSEKNIIAGDLVFTTSRRNYFWFDPNDGIGHVGLATGEGTIIHAANSKLGVIESPFEDFIKELKGIGRIIEDEDSLVTIESPAFKVVEESNEFRWKILQFCDP